MSESAEAKEKGNSIDQLVDNDPPSINTRSKELRYGSASKNKENIDEDRSDANKVEKKEEDQINDPDQQNSDENNESQSAQENNESNASRQESKNNKDNQSEDSESKSNDGQRRSEVPNSRKCFNKLCTSKKIYKKIRSRVEDNKYRFFCKNCYENYFNNSYCEFCEQIYSNNCQNEDDDKWIGCDSCERWNHIECQKKYRDKNVMELKDKNWLYQCLVCAQRTKNNHGDKVNKKNDRDPQERVNPRPKFQISKDQRVLIFHKKLQNFQNLEYFLQNYSFRLWINEGLIKQDIEQLRNLASNKPPAEQNVKKNFKKVKID